MGSWEVSDAHEELSRDLAPREAKSLLEQAHPIFLRLGMVRRQPISEGAVRFLEVQEHARIVDGGFDLQAIANDSCVAHEACSVSVAVVGHCANVEIIVSGPEPGPFLQDRQLGQSSLIDLEEESFEEAIVIGDWKAVFFIVVGAVEGVIPRETAVTA